MYLAGASVKVGQVSLTGRTQFGCLVLTIIDLFSFPVYSPIVAVLSSSLNLVLYTFLGASGSISGAEKKLVNVTAEQLRLQGTIPEPGNFDEASEELKADYRARSAELRTNC
jgi:hypothetical protein